MYITLDLNIDLINKVVFRKICIIYGDMFDIWVWLKHNSIDKILKSRLFIENVIVSVLKTQNYKCIKRFFNVLNLLTLQRLRKYKIKKKKPT